MTVRCRIIDKNGEIMDGTIATFPVCEAGGWVIEAPPYRIPTRTASFEYDHTTEDGMAVYLEAL